MTFGDKGARSLKGFCDWADIGPTKAYEEVKAGRLIITKLGKKTLVTAENAQKWLASLPTTTGKAA